jgi:hypothetical protein
MKKVIVILIANVALVMLSCNMIETVHSQEQTPYFYAYLAAMDLGATFPPLIACVSDVFAAPKPEGTINVLLNGTQCDSIFTDINSFMLFYPGYFGTSSAYLSMRLFYMPKENPFIGQQECEIQSSVGSAKGTVTIPVVETITSHQNGDSIQINEPLKITWDGNALNYYVYVTYSDTLRSFNIWFDTVVAGNEIILGIDTLPNSAYITDVQVYIYGINGLKVAAGTQGNMTGDGVGFLFAVNMCQSIKHGIELSIKHAPGLKKPMANGEVEKEFILKQIKNGLFKKATGQISGVAPRY